MFQRWRMFGHRIRLRMHMSDRLHGYDMQHANKRESTIQQPNPVYSICSIHIILLILIYQVLCIVTMLQRWRVHESLVDLSVCLRIAMDWQHVCNQSQLLSK